MTKKKLAWLKPGLFGVAIGMIGFALIGFNANLVVSKVDAQRNADRASRSAVVAALTPVCVARFQSVPPAERPTHIEAIRREASWQRGAYVGQRGWATMPGGTSPNDEVAEACSSLLLNIPVKTAG